MAEKYGFYTVEYESGTVEALMTGDGRTQFTDIVNTDGTTSLGIGYGDITKSINEKVKHPKGTRLTDISVQWEVRFENPASVDAMIETLQRVKARLIEMAMSKLKSVEQEAYTEKDAQDAINDYYIGGV